MRKVLPVVQKRQLRFLSSFIYKLDGDNLKEHSNSCSENSNLKACIIFNLGIQISVAVFCRFQRINIKSTYHEPNIKKSQIFLKWKNLYQPNLKVNIHIFIHHKNSTYFEPKTKVNFPPKTEKRLPIAPKTKQSPPPPKKYKLEVK